MVTDFKLRQSIKVLAIIDETLFGMFMDVRPQLKNADSPMYVTLLGIVTEAKRVQL